MALPLTEVPVGLNNEAPQMLDLTGFCSEQICKWWLHLQHKYIAQRLLPKKAHLLGTKALTCNQNL